MNFNGFTNDCRYQVIHVGSYDKLSPSNALANPDTKAKACNKCQGRNPHLMNTQLLGRIALDQMGEKMLLLLFVTRVCISD